MLTREGAALALAGAWGRELSAAELSSARDSIAAACARGSARWPGVEVNDVAFAEFVGQRLRAQDSTDVGDALRDLHWDDLYLTHACAKGDPRALASLDRTYLVDVGAWIAKLDSSSTMADEVRQSLREKLFVEDGAPAKILDYSGRGPLGGWLRVAAVRTAQNILRARAPARAVALQADVARDAARAADDPELDFFKRRYASEFRDAFRATLEALPARERNVLRLHFVDGLSSSAIAKVYGVSSATIRSWLKQWREHMLDETRRQLAARLQADPQEVDSVIALVRSQFDLTVSRLLR